jgi:hypothetical protein
VSYGSPAIEATDIQNVLTQTPSNRGAGYAISRNLDGSIRWVKQFKLVDTNNSPIQVDVTLYSICATNNYIYITGEIANNLTGMSPKSDGYLVEQYELSGVVYNSSRVLYKATLNVTNGFNESVGFILKYSFDGTFISGFDIRNNTNDYIYSIASNESNFVVYRGTETFLNGSSTGGNIIVDYLIDNGVPYISASDGSTLGSVNLNIDSLLNYKLFIRSNNAIDFKPFK